MKALITDFIMYFLISAFSIIMYDYLRELDKCPETTLQLNSEAQFILESVENDSLLQKFILSPTYRERVREAVEEFDKKYPK